MLVYYKTLPITHAEYLGVPYSSLNKHGLFLVKGRLSWKYDFLNTTCESHDYWHRSVMT
jgi:hypothetical protein